MPPDAGAGRIRDAWESKSDSTDAARRICADATLWGTNLDEVPGFTSLVAGHLSVSEVQTIGRTP